MSNDDNTLRQMPDIAHEVTPEVAGKLDWVGMGDIELPVRIDDAQGNTVQSTALVTAYVNLANAEEKGIHMSRLYLHLDQAFRERSLSPAVLRQLLRSFLDSHEGLSDRALVRVDFDYMVRRRALASDNEGWRRYPVSMIGLMDGSEFSLEMGLEVLYSSTCPCSAALSRQLIQEQFEKTFAAGEALDFEAVKERLGSEQGIVARPHSQRAAAELLTGDYVNQETAALRTSIKVKRDLLVSGLKKVGVRFDAEPEGRGGRGAEHTKFGGNAHGP